MDRERRRTLTGINFFNKGRPPSISLQPSTSHLKTVDNTPVKIVGTPFFNFLWFHDSFNVKVYDINGNTFLPLDIIIYVQINIVKHKMNLQLHEVVKQMQFLYQLIRQWGIWVFDIILGVILEQVYIS